MQVFVPSTEVTECVACLDPSRLGNQVYREGMTLLRGGWPNHPCAKMWKGYEPALAYYLWCGVEQLIHRGKDYTDRRWCKELEQHDMTTVMPPWWGDERVHSSHRAALLYKDPVWYGKFGWSEQPVGPSAITGKLQYYWPV